MVASDVEWFSYKQKTHIFKLTCYPVFRDRSRRALVSSVRWNQRRGKQLSLAFRRRSVFAVEGCCLYGVRLRSSTLIEKIFHRPASRRQSFDLPGVFREKNSTRSSARHQLHHRGVDHHRGPAWQDSGRNRLISARFWSTLRPAAHARTHRQLPHRRRDRVRRNGGGLPRRAGPARTHGRDQGAQVVRGRRGERRDALRARGEEPREPAAREHHPRLRLPSRARRDVHRDGVRAGDRPVRPPREVRPPALRRRRDHRDAGRARARLRPLPRRSCIATSSPRTSCCRAPAA